MAHNRDNSEPAGFKIWASTTSRREKEREKHTHKKTCGKYSKTHSWGLTMHKWKRKALHQHITAPTNHKIHESSNPRNVFLFSFSSFILPHFSCLLICCRVHHYLPHPLVPLWLWSPPAVGPLNSPVFAFDHKRETVRLCTKGSVSVQNTTCMLELTPPEGKEFVLQDVFSVCPLVHQVELGDHTDCP